MSQRPRRLVPCLAVLYVIATPSFGMLRPDERSRARGLPPVDRGAETAPATRRAPDPSQRAAVARLRMEVPGLSVTWNPAQGTPAFVRGESGLTAGGRGSRAGAVRDFLLEHCALFRACSGQLELGHDVVERVEGDGVSRLAFKQTVAGREVFRAGLGATFDRSGRLVSLSSSVLPDLRPGPPPRLDPERLLELALHDAGAGLDLGSVRAASRPIAYPLRGVARPAELVWVRGKEEASYLLVVDAVDGSLLMRSHMVMYSQPQGTVFERAPNDLQDPNDPSPVQPVLTPFTGTPSASPIGWVTDDPSDCERTAGNNVFLASYWGLGSVSGFLNLVPCVEGAHFEFTWSRDYTDCPHRRFRTRIIECHQAHEDPLLAATNLFYHANRLHDILFSLGFTESWGNFQEVNLSGDPGALGGDGIEIYSSGGADAGLGCNARFFPAPDGERSTIQMGFFSRDPDNVECNRLLPRVQNVDSSLDPDIIYHEYAHGLSTRIVGMENMDPGTSAGLLGEGWSDFVAIHLLGDPGAPGDEADPNRPFAYGAYEITGGGRRYPYSIDEGVNPLTFDDLCGTGCLIHDDGEIWANMLWEVRYRLIQDHGFAVGQQKMGLLLVDSMKNLAGGGPPDILTSRDALLSADGTRYQAQNCTAIWEAFTERGLGPQADFADPDRRVPLSDFGPLPDSDGDGVIDICESGGGTGGNCGQEGCHEIIPKF